MADTAKTETKAAAPAVTKPERPNEEEYKEKLGKAEKELKAAEDRMVGSPFSCVLGDLHNAAAWLHVTADGVLITATGTDNLHRN